MEEKRSPSPPKPKTPPLTLEEEANRILAEKKLLEEGEAIKGRGMLDMLDDMAVTFAAPAQNWSITMPEIDQSRPQTVARPGSVQAPTDHFRKGKANDGLLGRAAAFDRAAIGWEALNEKSAETYYPTPPRSPPAARAGTPPKYRPTTPEEGYEQAG